MFRIRSTRLSDAKALGSVHYRAWQETYRGMISDDYLDWLSPDKSEKIFAHRAGGNTFAAEIEGEIVGFAAIGHGREADMPPRTGELCGIYVLSDYHKRGIGGALFREAENKFRALGYKRMFLWVLDANLDAQSFYAHMGMKKDGGYKHAVLGNPITEYRMIKEFE